MDVNRLPAPNFGASEWQPACAIQMAEPDGPPLVCRLRMNASQSRQCPTCMSCRRRLEGLVDDESLVGWCDFHRFSPMHILGIVPPEAMPIGLMLWNG